jgi:hypothetical protein
MEIKHLGGPQTPSNDCPAVYQSDRGTYLVQGYRIPEEYRDRVQNLADNETVVEIPAHLVEIIKSL